MTFSTAVIVINQVVGGGMSHSAFPDKGFSLTLIKPRSNVELSSRL